MSVLPELERDLRAAVQRDQRQEAAGPRVRMNGFSLGVAVSALLVLAIAALALREVRREPQPAKPPPPRTITIGSVRQAIERHHLHGAMNVVCSVGGRLYALCPKHTPRTGIPPALVQYERRGFIIVGYRSNAEAQEILPALASGAGSAYWLVVGPAAVKLPDVPAAERPAVRRALLREAREPVTTPSFSAIRQMAESFGIGPLSACSYGASIGRRCRAGGEPLVTRQLAREAISPATQRTREHPACRCSATPRTPRPSPRRGRCSRTPRTTTGSSSVGRSSEPVSSISRGCCAARWVSPCHGPSPTPGSLRRSTASSSPSGAAPTLRSDFPMPCAACTSQVVPKA